MIAGSSSLVGLDSCTIVPSVDGRRIHSVCQPQCPQSVHEVGCLQPRKRRILTVQLGESAHDSWLDEEFPVGLVE